MKDQAAQTLTFLFTDIEGSTPLWDRDPHAMRAATEHHNAILGLRAEFPPIRTREALRTNLPPALTSFVGREPALADVRARAVASRLVTLLGAGGTGKTRLMTESAAELVDVFADGVWLVEFAPIADPTQLAHAIAEALALESRT